MQNKRIVFRVSLVECSIIRKKSKMAIDPGLAAIVSAAALASTGTINKLLGPTAEYFGKEIESFAKKRAENIGRILKKAIKILGPKIDEPGQVHPKLLKGLILEGSFCDDELTAEYYGGILASSRTGVSRDDRGASFLEQVSHLSFYQVRTHFICYTVLKILFQGTQLNPGIPDGRYNMKTYIPDSDYIRSMAFKENNEDSESCRVHSITGLNSRHRLLSGSYIGDPDYLSQNSPLDTFPESGLLFEPSLLGIELYLWATGNGHFLCESFLNPELSIEVPEGIEIPTKAFGVFEEHKRRAIESQQSNP